MTEEINEKGEKAISHLNESCSVEHTELQPILDGQMKENANRAKSYSYVLSALRSKKSIKKIGVRADWIDGNITFMSILHRVYAYGKHTLKRMQR